MTRGTVQEGNPKVCQIDWAGETFELCPERAVHWPARRTLIIADPHFGKAAAFRHHGIPVPAGTTGHALARLTELIESRGVERLIVLGDFLHAPAGRSEATMEAIANWRSNHAALDVTLVRGNHDLSAGDPPAAWHFGCADEPLLEDQFAWCHEPRRIRGRFVFAGHIHPCVVLRDVDGTSARVPCFHFATRVAVLPAFGAFTGTHPIRTGRHDRIFAAGPVVLELPTRSGKPAPSRAGC